MLNLQQTPKLLRPLVKDWSPQAFVVSFKLETDVNIISKKARESLNKNSHQVKYFLHDFSGLLHEYDSHWKFVDFSYTRFYKSYCAFYLYLQVVISNILQTRRKTVVIVTANEENAIWMSDSELEQGKDIEEKIVADLVKKHGEFIRNNSLTGNVMITVYDSMLHRSGLKEVQPIEKYLDITNQSSQFPAAKGKGNCGR